MAEDKDQTEDAQTEEAAEGEEGAAEGDAAAGGSKKKIIIIAGAAVLLLVGVGAGLYFTGMLDSLLGKKTEEHAEGEEGHEEAAGDHGGGGGGHGAAAGGVFLAIPPMIVNLNSEDGTPRYLRLSVQLEMKSAVDVAAVEAVLPRVVDQFQTYLRELRVKDLRGSAGIYRLQMELLWRVNQAAAPIEIKDVLFQEILIQ